MTYFKLPITYTNECHNIDDNIITDLELVNPENSLYKKIFNPKSKLGEKIVNLWTKHYTTNTKYLEDTQTLIQKEIPQMKNIESDEYELLERIGNLKQNDTDFHEKYNYIEWKYLQNLNNNAVCMQWLSAYNMLSPVLTLAMPILFLILPFLILKIQGQNVSFSNYVELLKIVFKKHQIGKLFDIHSVSWDQRIYILISLFFYVVQIYQNICSCIRFVKNIKFIHRDLFLIRKHVDDTIIAINDFDLQCTNIDSYEEFVSDLRSQLVVLERFKVDLDNIIPNKLTFTKINNIGHTMKCYYMLHNNESYKNALQYSYDFWGYIDILNGIKENVNTNYLGKCKFGNKTKFNNAFYPITHNNPVKNTYNLNKQLLITGPNAAGKTTILKTTLFNILISQQIGYGCYKSATIYPYHKIHCYINIPDTSNRDSLFQAEARRCKNILDNIKDDNIRHFCVFDELFSGTNPYEAISSAVSFLKYLNKYKNVSFIITTHYLDICNKLSNDKKTHNCNMKINTKENGEFLYTYKLDSGISDVKGGIKVLNDLEYPTEIIENTNNLIGQLNI